MPSPVADDVLLTGWGLTMPSRATVQLPRDASDVAREVADVGPRGLLARGAGRSYGDAAQNSGGTVLDVAALHDVEVLDDGDVIAGGGALFADLIPVLLARGRFLPVTPGTKYVTVGGAIAADVHGKNHHVDGSFGAHVRWIDLVTADGALTRITPDSDSETGRIFHATTGGMGLTGVIVAARFATIAASATVRVDTDRAPDLDSLMALMTERDESYRYSVAWLDGMARGARLGRGVLTRGDHAPSARDYRAKTSPRLSVPHLPVSPLTRGSLAAFNEVWFRKAPRRRRDELVGIDPFFYPLDAVGDWNRLYGRRGFLQYQFAVPDSGAAVIRQALERLTSIGAPSFLSVLKRFGPGRPQAPLSFPIEGWTLAVDVPVRVRGLAQTLDELDDVVLSAGGRLYLAKDSRAVAATIAAGYPGLDDFRELRRRLDPNGVFVSDLSRRLDL
jgi:decaprenylphospho-beta-D-ribofuranose 2-oxidase